MNILFLTSAAPAKAGFSTSEKRPPLGLGCLISILKKEGHSVYFSDEYLKPSNVLDSSFIEDHNIDFVGIYSNTICYESTLSMLEKLKNKRDKLNWKGKILLGGPHTSVGQDSIPIYVDHVVVGEGEISTIDIINGKVNERIVVGKRIKNLDELPFPAWEEFIFRTYDWALAWLNAYPIYTMNTSRGCPFNCTFCSVKAVWGKSYRFMSAERVVSDIEYMVKYYGAKGIYFREDHFTLNKKRVIDFCELLLKKNISIEWACETRVDDMSDSEYQKLMARAGCKAFYIGVESGSPRMLEFYKKGETIDQFIKAFHISKKYGIKTYASLIVGFPGETDKDVALTEDLIEIIKPDVVGYNIYLGLPGSESYDYIRDNEMYEYKDKYEVLYPAGYLENVKRYYNNDPYFLVYTEADIVNKSTVSNRLNKCRFHNWFKIAKIKRFLGL